MSSGSVSSFNDEDYEVDENSDEEEQEEPGDYIKGTYVSQRKRENLAIFKWLYNPFRVLFTRKEI